MARYVVPVGLTRKLVLGCLSAVLFAALFAFASLDYLTDKAQILERAKTEATAWTAPEGPLGKWNKKRGLSGNFTYDISFRDKGQMVTVYVIPDQNANQTDLATLKDQLMKMRFNFKTPKGQIYKLRHTVSL